MCKRCDELIHFQYWEFKDPLTISFMLFIFTIVGNLLEIEPKRIRIFELPTLSLLIGGTFLRSGISAVVLSILSGVNVLL